MIFPTVTVNSELFINSNSRSNLKQIHDFLNYDFIRNHPVAKSLPVPQSPIEKNIDNFYTFSCGTYTNNFTIFTRSDFIINYIRVATVFLKEFSMGLYFYMPKIPCDESDVDFSYVTMYPHILIPIQLNKLYYDSKKKELYFDHVYATLQSRLSPIKEQYIKTSLERIHKNFFSNIQNVETFLQIDEYRLIPFEPFLKNHLFSNRSKNNENLLFYLMSSIKFIDPRYTCKYKSMEFNNSTYVMSALVNFTYDNEDYKVYLAYNKTNKYYIVCEMGERLYDFNDLCIQDYFIVNILLYSMYNNGIVEYDGVKTVNDKGISGKFFIIKITESVGIELFFTCSTYEYVIVTEIMLK